jgi:microcystin-dependent protein
MAKKAKVYTGTEWVDLAAATVDLSAVLPAGIVAPFAGSTAPDGYLLCDGSAISRTGYARLFTAISTAYGVGDGSTTFNIPDLRGRTVAALDNMGGTDAGRLDLANTLGTATGTQNHTLTTSEIPVHSHPNTLSSNTVASSSHRHDFAFSLLDSLYDAQGPNAAMGTSGMAGAYKYSTGAWSGGLFDGNQFATTVHSNTGSGVGATVGRYISYGDTNTPSASTTVGITNANAGSGGAHNNMQPTMLLNYIIKV